MLIKDGYYNPQLLFKGDNCTQNAYKLENPFDDVIDYCLLSKTTTCHCFIQGNWKWYKLQNDAKLQTVNIWQRGLYQRASCGGEQGAL